MRRAALLLLALLAASPAASENSPAGPDFGVELFPGSRALPETARRLDLLRSVRWLTSGAFHADASLSQVLAHFRAEQKRHEGPDSLSGEPSARLKEWLRKNPEELAKYREFQRAQAGQVPPNWQTFRQSAAEIPASLGDVESRWRMVDVETGRSEPARWPGDSGGPLALTADGLVLYWGLPTEGAPPEFTRV